MKPHARSRAAVWLATACVAARCSNADPLGAQARGPNPIVVGSADFVLVGALLVAALAPLREGPVEAVRRRPARALAESRAADGGHVLP